MIKKLCITIIMQLLVNSTLKIIGYILIALRIPNGTEVEWTGKALMESTSK